MSEELVHFQHTTGSKVPRFDLIPYEALVAMANRYELGEEKHKGKCWNALSSQAGLEDDKWIIARASHVIKHAFLFLTKYAGLMEDDGDDDAAAIMWGGSVLWAALNHRRKKNDIDRSESR